MSTTAMPRGVAISRDAPRIEEKTNSFALTVSAPGVKTQDIKVTVEHNVHTGQDVIKVCGQSASAAHTHFVNWSTTLPKTADGAAATAEAVDGILSVSIPKKSAEDSKAKATRILSVDSTLPSESTPSSDSEDDDDTYSLTIRAPGIAAADLSITLQSTLLKIVGETKRTGMKIDKVYQLPRDVDIHGDKCAASHVDGVLSMTLQKKATPSSVTIPVRGPGEAAAAAVPLPIEPQPEAMEAEDQKDEDGVMV